MTLMHVRGKMSLKASAMAVNRSNHATAMHAVSTVIGSGPMVNRETYEVYSGLAVKFDEIIKSLEEDSL